MAAASINIVHALYRQVSADIRGGRHLAIVQNLVGLKMRQLKHDGPWSVIISNAYSRDHHLHKTCYAGTKEYPSLGLLYWIGGFMASCHLARWPHRNHFIRAPYSVFSLLPFLQLFFLRVLLFVSFRIE